MADERKTVAAIVTEYRIRSHADNIVTRLLEGYELHWTPVAPRLRVASLYTDQVPANDISRDLAATHGVPIFPTIRQALTLGGDELAVDGVVIVGEHGTYPFNERGQHLYPRRRFFEETVAVFRQSGRVVPVFNDKHLAWNWADAKWIYDTAREIGIPFMAGSSMPLTVRVPPMRVPPDAEIEEIVVVAHGGLESYGFHALEIAQCLAERRRGGETGVASVQCLTGDGFWEALRAGKAWSQELAAAALAVSVHAPGTAVEFYAPRFAPSGVDERPLAGDKPPRYSSGFERGAERDATGGSRSGGRYASEVGRAGAQRESSEPAIFLVEYRDGLHLTVLMLNGYVTQRGAAVQVRGEAAPLAALFTQARRQPLFHFDHQVDYIERLVETGRAPYPVERTLLTTGMVDAVMISRFEGNRRVETPYLDVTYQAPAAPPHHVRSFVIPGREDLR